MSRTKRGPSPGGSPLVFERLELRRLPGFPRAGFTLDALSPGINLIYGPNGSGKSSTARAMAALLWPESARGREELFARLQVGDEAWAAEVDGDFRSWQRGGAASPAPPLPPAEVRDRYFLALPDLLRADDRNFAAAIAKESLGGYDIRAAAASAGFDRVPAGRKNVPQALKAAQQRLNEARAEQERLVDDERRLAELERVRQRADQAAARVSQVDRLLEWITAKDEAEAAKEALHAFYPWMERMRGDEGEALRQLDAEKAKALQTIDDAIAEENEALEQRAKIGLPPEGLSQRQLDRLKAAADEILSLEQRRLAIEPALSAAIEKRSLAAKLLGSSQPERAREVDHETLVALTRLASRWGEWIAERQSVAAERRRLSVESGEREDAERLQQGVELLLQWMRAGGRAVLDRQGLLLSTLGWASALILSLALTWFVDGRWLGVTAALALLSVYAWTRPGNRGRPDPRHGFQQAFERLGLPLPASWTEADVSQRVDELNRARLRAEQEALRQRRLAELDAELQELDEQGELLREEGARLARHLGLSIDEKVTTLSWLAQTISDWQKAELEVTGLTEELKQITEQIHRETAGIEGELIALGYPTLEAPGGVEAIARLKATLKDLEERFRQWHAAEERIRGARLRREQAEKIIRSTEREREALYARLGLAGDPEEVERMIRTASDRFEAYQAAARKYRETQSILASRRRSLLVQLGVEGVESVEAVEGLVNTGLDSSDGATDHAADEAGQGAAEVGTGGTAGAGEQDDDTLEVLGRPLARWTEEEARQLKDQLLLEAERSKAISLEIGGIQERIKSAKEGKAVEAAVAAYEQAESELADLLEEECRYALGHLIEAYIQRATKERERPEVFRRARERFAAITHGAYQLELDDGEHPLFTAVDAQTGERKSLDELSSGTRAQLLIAVRVAFVEHMESELRLPIVIDEALANSDDARAEALIDALITLAADGRQVFYFTAQADEVAKWEAALRNQSVPYQLIDLQRVRSLDQVRRRPLPDLSPSLRVQAPRPEGLSYEAYGRMLQVPGIDPYADHIGQVHLWHLLDDADVLYRLLQFNIDSWGAFQTFYQFGGAARMGDDVQEAYAKADAAARCLEAVIGAWRVGRGRPLDRQALIDSAAISPAFLESAAELAAACEYDAKRLIDAIDGGALKRFRSENKELLRAYFEEQGYLDHRSALTHREIEMQVTARLGHEIGKGVISAEHVERLIKTVLLGSHHTPMPPSSSPKDRNTSLKPASK